MIAGQLIKITGTRKLMVKITENEYTRITERLTFELERLKFSADKLATFTLDNDDYDSEDPDDSALSYFCMLTLDKYDKQVLEKKFEPLVRKHITFNFTLKPYDFTPDGSTDRLTGVTLQLLQIRRDVKKQAALDATVAAAKERFLAAEEEERQRVHCADMKVLAAQMVIDRQNAEKFGQQPAAEAHFQAAAEAESDRQAYLEEHEAEKKEEDMNHAPAEVRVPVVARRRRP